MHVNLTKTMQLHYNMILFCNVAFDDKGINFQVPLTDMISIHGKESPEKDPCQSSYDDNGLISSLCCIGNDTETRTSPEV